MKKTTLLTGATDGIGLEAAKMFVQDGHILLLHGRNKEKLEKTKETLLSINKEAQIYLYQAYFSSLSQVKKMIEEIKENHTTIDVLINNAGIFVVKPEDSFTQDGLDIRFSVNTVAPYLITSGLLCLLWDDSRVVNLSSAAQAPLNYQALTNPNEISDSEAYAQSKLAITMMTMAMSEQYPNGPTFIAVNPKSFLGSKMVKEAYGQEGFDIQIGADIIYRASLSSEFQGASGKYYDNDYQMFDDPHRYAMNKENRLKLMEYLHQL
ncbi:SDR family NAD(P)-dependent oxidoreductase [Tannockella kyphosi]|uniref:SDR family NAD(P)-dependent oxidoreductase n=1 Tax=Tannockella kyphosi TaxID=2899121 RepID=UPI0020135A69|nr:SDR family NAD(P)-dependent oxidoreductase [Tannockella kyphosi]